MSKNHTLYRNIIKRGLDLFISLLLLAVLFLPLLLVSLFLAITGSGVFFMQYRPGKDGRIFRLIKFRTMNDRRGTSGELLSDGERLTAAGRLIRKYSIDELPQLWNVVKGDMSLVGPRPLLPEYLSLYTEEQNRRHEVKPGITGWAQVNGRNAISWEEKFRYDVWYADNLSFMLDMKILFMTLLKVIRTEGITSGSAATMEKFTGQQKPVG